MDARDSSSQNAKETYILRFNSEKKDHMRNM